MVQILALIFVALVIAILGVSTYWFHHYSKLVREHMRENGYEMEGYISIGYPWLYLQYSMYLEENNKKLPTELYRCLWIPFVGVVLCMLFTFGFIHLVTTVFR